MLLTGEVLIPTSLQMVEKIIKLRIVFAQIVNCYPRDTQVNC